MENMDTNVSTKFSHLWTCYLEFENVSRISGENLGDFLNKWKEKMSNAQSAGCNYSDALLACKLLERSNLDGDAFQSIITSVEDSGPDLLFSEVLSRLEGSTTQENSQLDKNIFGHEENEGRMKLEIHEENEDFPEIHEEKKDWPEIHVKEEDLLEIHEEWIEKSPNDAEIQSPEQIKHLADDFAQRNSDQLSCGKCKKILNFFEENTLSYDHVTGNIICKDCEVSTTKLAKSRKEKKEDLHEKSRTCQICGKSFPWPSDLQRHMTCHTKEKNFKCEFCPLAYRDKMALKVHMKKHLENKSLKCPNCPKIFVCDFDLKTHLRKVHPIESRFHCDKCNYKTNEKTNLDAHLATHSSFRPFKCNLCGRLFKLKKSAMRHLFLLHKRELHKFDSIEELIGKNRENVKASASSTLQGTLSTSPVLNNVENEGLVKIEDQSKEEPQDNSEFQLSEQRSDFSEGSFFLGGSNEKASTCQICGKSFPRPSKLQRHMTSHTKEKTFKCEFCPSVYCYEYSLKLHMKKHLANNSLKCPNCPKFFACDLYLKQHLRQVHPIDDGLECEENLETPTSTAFEGNISTSPVLNNVKNEGLVKIEDQSKEDPLDVSELQLSGQTTDFSGGSSFLGGSHKNTSRENEPSQKFFFPCDICGNFYQKEENFLRHCQQVHGSGVLQEKQNLDVTPQRDDKEAVEENKKPATCHICGEVFSLKKSLRAHLKRSHAPLVLQEGQAEDVQFQCEKCDKTFHVQARFLRHQKYCGKRSLVQNRVGHKSTTCHICGFTASRYYYLKTHMIKHTKEKIFKCEYCPVAYAWESALINHRKKHLENKSLECPKCLKIFVCDVDFKAHLRRAHPKEHKFHCDKCSYRTISNDNLQRHLMSHSSFQPLKCNLCEKLFKEKKSVKRHLLVCHKMEINEKDNIEELIGKNES